MSDESKNAARSWELPVIEPAEQDVESGTDVFNRRRDWKYEPPEEEIEILPPTAEEIEGIRAAAHADGFAQGQQEGREQGQQQGHQLGFEQGLAEGTEQGMEQGLASAKEIIQQQVSALTSLIEQLQKPLTRVEQVLEKELVQLAVSLAKAVIRAEVKTNEDLIFRALSEGLKVLPIQENHYQIHLHPDDILLITQHFSQEEIDRHHWNLVESPQLSRGGCEIITESNAVEMTIERRVRDVLDRFLLEQGLSQVHNDADDDPL